MRPGCTLEKSIVILCLISILYGCVPRRESDYRMPVFEQELAIEPVQLCELSEYNYIHSIIGASTQKLGFVPESSNDMIFAILCEELGLFGAIALIVLYLFLLYRMMMIANRSKDLFGSMIVVGVMAHIAIQVVLNIAVATNSMPTTGVSLPFISYGGSSVSFLMAEMGMVLRVARENEV